MANVVTSEGFQQFIETGKVEEFKPPETPKDEQKEVPKPEDKLKEEADATAKPDAVDKTEDDDDSDLSEKVRQKIGKKHRAMKEAEEFAEQMYNERRAAEKRAEELERKLREAEEKSRPAPVEDQEPKQEDFKTVQDYIKAKVAFDVKQELKETRERERQERLIEEANRVKAEFANRIAETMKKVPDFEEVTSSVDTELPPYITQHILESDVGPMLGYALAKDEKELNRILKLSPIRAIAELGKLEAKLEAQGKSEPKVEIKPEVKAGSKAPPPITPIAGNAAGIQKDPSQMTFKELREYRRQEAINKQRRG